MKATWSSLFSGLLLLFFLQSCQPKATSPLTGLWEMRFESEALEGYWIHFFADQTFELGQWDQPSATGSWTLSQTSILQLENFPVTDQRNERVEWLLQSESNQPDKLTLRRTNPEVGSGKSKLYLTRIQHPPTKS